MQSRLYEEARKLKTSCIKLNSDRINPESLHTHLFQGLFCRAMGVVSENYRTEVSELEILVDEVNARQLQQFCNVASEISDPSPKKVKVSGWHPVKNEVVHGSIEFSIGPESFSKGLNALPQYRISIGDQHLIMPADVIANSIHHHFKSRTPDQTGRPLLRKSAILNHPLSRSFCGLSDHGELGDSDSIFMYMRE